MNMLRFNRIKVKCKFLAKLKEKSNSKSFNRIKVKCKFDYCFEQWK